VAVAEALTYCLQLRELNLGKNYLLNFSSAISMLVLHCMFYFSDGNQISMVGALAITEAKKSNPLLQVLLQSNGLLLSILVVVIS
jgi:hypothetical protein